MRILSILLSALVMALSPACTTTTSTTGTVARAPNWPVIELSARTACKWTTKAVLDKNPDYAGSAAAVNAAVATVFSGTPTAALIQEQLRALVPALTAADAALYASALMDVYDAYVAATGRAELVHTDEHVARLVTAITTGIAEGVALHRATQPAP